MIRKGKLVKNTAIALAIISVFGSALSSVSAAEIVKNTKVVEYDAVTAATTAESTEKDIDITLRHLTEDKDSSGNRYLESSKLKTVGSKKYIVMTFNNGNMFTAMQASVKGKNVETSFNFDKESDTVTVEFEISSLSDYMELSFSYNTPIGSMTHSAKIQTTENVNATIPEDEIDITLRHLTEDKDSSGNRYLESSKLKIVNGKKYIVMTFNNGNMFTAMQASVKGKDVETSFNFDKESDTVTVEFEISSLSDYMELSFSYNTPIGSMTHSAKIQIEENKDAVKPEEDNEEDDAITSPTPGTPEEDAGNDSNEEESTTKYKNGYYQVNNIVDHESETGKDMARRLLNEVTNMEVKDDKIYLTFTMNEELAGFVKDMTAKVDNKTVEIKKVDDNHFTVEVPSLDAKLQLSMYITMMGSSQVFDITFDESTVKLLSSTENPSDEENNDSSSNGSNNGGNNNSSNGSSNNGNNNSSSNDEEVKDEVVKGKLYTIKNEVIYDNQTGYDMVRRYLNETSKIEEIDGKKYLTLTFTGVEFMKDHKVYVNGTLIDYTVASKTSESISIRFEIQDINDDIKVQLVVVPMGNRTVEFGVKLLEDTLELVGEFDVEGDSIVGDTIQGDITEGNTNGGDDTLPQTGSAFGSEILLGLGGLLAASGALLRRKRK